MSNRRFQKPARGYRRPSVKAALQAELEVQTDELEHDPYDPQIHGADVGGGDPGIAALMQRAVEDARRAGLAGPGATTARAGLGAGSVYGAAVFDPAMPLTVLRQVPTPAALLTALLSTAAPAQELALPAQFGDHMVLQREAPVPVWGRAAPEEWVAVTVAGQTARARADADGRWRAVLGPMSAGGPYRVRVDGLDARLVLEDVWVGDVWLCSGQSNMVWPLKRASENEAEVADADRRRIRLLRLPQMLAQKLPAELDAAWQRCEPMTAAECSSATSASRSD